MTQIVNVGYFVITNMNSGDSQTIIGDESESVRLHVSQGDVLKLQYIPEEQNKGLNYQVSFTIHEGKTIYIPAPNFSVAYKIQDIAPGKYTLTMSALVNESQTQAVSFAACILVITE